MKVDIVSIYKVDTFTVGTVTDIFFLLHDVAASSAY